MSQDIARLPMRPFAAIHIVNSLPSTHDRPAMHSPAICTLSSVPPPASRLQNGIGGTLCEGPSTQSGAPYKTRSGSNSLGILPNTCSHRSFSPREFGESQSNRPVGVLSGGLLVLAEGLSGSGFGAANDRSRFMRQRGAGEHRCERRPCVSK